MVGTSGIASSYTMLYVANNSVITIIDQFGNTEDIPHGFDWVTSITASELFIFGIYNTNNRYGLFSMDVNTHFIKSVLVDYTPVNLIFINQLLVVLDSDFKTYEYERNLTLRSTKERDTKVSIENPIKFMTIGLAKNDYLLYYSKDRDVYSEKEKLFTADGNILSLLYYSNFLFVIYVSLYNHYSIVQYDLVQKKKINTVDGGHISGPPVYSCIYDYHIYISASTNNKIPLEMFELPGKKAAEEQRTRMAYPMFELNKINHRFLTDEVNIDVDKIKAIQDAGVLDTEPAKSSLTRYYIWLFIFIFIVAILLLGFIFKESSVIPAILLSILFIALSFMIKNNWTI